MTSIRPSSVTGGWPTISARSLTTGIGAVSVSMIGWNGPVKRRISVRIGSRKLSTRGPTSRYSWSNVTAGFDVVVGVGQAERPLQPDVADHAREPGILGADDPRSKGEVDVGVDLEHGIEADVAGVAGNRSSPRRRCSGRARR